jgi:hypothetical protein
MRGDRFGGLVRAVGRRPLPVLLAVGVLALAGAAPELCPAFSLTNIFSSVNARDQAAVRELLDAVPAYFSQGSSRATAARRTSPSASG